jgi:hypothetical protein
VRHAVLQSPLRAFSSRVQQEIDKLLVAVNQLSPGCAVIQNWRHSCVRTSINPQKGVTIDDR